MRNMRAQESVRPSPIFLALLGVTAVGGVLAWLAGVLVYNVSNPTTLGVFFPAWIKIVPVPLTLLGGSLPSFFAALIIYALLALVFLRRKYV